MSPSPQTPRSQIPISLSSSSITWLRKTSEAIKKKQNLPLFRNERMPLRILIHWSISAAQAISRDGLTSTQSEKGLSSSSTRRTQFQSRSTSATHDSFSLREPRRKWMPHQAGSHRDHRYKNRWERPQKSWKQLYHLSTTHLDRVASCSRATSHKALEVWAKVASAKQRLILINRRCTGRIPIRLTRRVPRARSPHPTTSPKTSTSLPPLPPPLRSLTFHHR